MYTLVQTLNTCSGAGVDDEHKGRETSNRNNTIFD